MGLTMVVTFEQLVFDDLRFGDLVGIVELRYVLCGRNRED